MPSTLEWLNTPLYLIVVITLCLSAYYSIRSRRKQEQRERGLLTARMNMSMGVMLITIGLIQTLLFESSTIRVVFAVLCLLLGLFNFFAGVRNHSFFSRMKP